MSDIELNGFALGSDFIDDGYSRDGTINAEANTNGPLSFAFRPAMAEQVSKLIDAGTNDEKYMAQAIDMLPKLLLGWDLKDRTGAVVKISRDAVSRVNRKLLVKIIDQVFFGTAPEAALKN